MPDLVCLVRNHGYSDDTPVYVSWLDGIYYVTDSDVATENMSFKISTSTGGVGIVQYTSSVIEGYVRESSGSTATTISGLDHLEGETVYVTSEGQYKGAYKVSSGSITLTESLEAYQAGLFRTASIVPRDIDYQCTGHTTTKRSNRVVLNLYQTKGGKIGPSSSRLENIPDTDSLTTGLREVSIPGGYARDTQIHIKQDVPLPMTILSISYDMGVSND